MKYEIDCPKSDTCQEVRKLLSKPFKQEYKTVEALVKLCGKCYLKEHR